MALLYISLGSNLGDKEAQINTAIKSIKERIGYLVTCSAFFYSEPWGYESEHSFLNACLVVETTRSPKDCMVLLQETEKGMGRLKTAKGGYKDRNIDLDILFYDQLILNEEDLVIPHPLLQKRLFVLKPLSEIAPDFIHPVLHKSVSTLLSELTGQS
jgi:2-amino-4-hydroxy-6-hydroxymethyldihydropteridine diphosphokinase